jgi:4-amino-4-deoxy-L-arabinose transferase-like glycosyltransferase
LDKRSLLVLLLCGAAAALLEAYFIAQPGTMDACYYYSGGTSLAKGRGLSEDFLWNYLDDPSGIPHPSFSYWMPLPSLVASIGMAFGQTGFRQAQLPFLVFAAFFPLLVYWLGYQWTGNNRIAMLAGFFSIGSGFYTIYWVNIESFLLYAWIGGLLLAVIPRLMRKEGRLIPLLAGFLCGLAHLARADGIFLLGLVVLGIAFSRSRLKTQRIEAILIVAAGYACVCGFWYIRNLSVYGTLFPRGGLRTLWLITYNDLFHFPASELTMERFLSAGVSTLLATRWESFLWNFQTLLFVLGLVFLAPFIVFGMYILRKHPSIQFGLIYLGLLFLLMTFVYPLQGSRGGFFHSTSALLATVCIAAAVGLDRSVEWIGQKRKWNISSARWILLPGIVLFSMLASVWIFQRRAIGDDIGHPAWSDNSQDFFDIMTLLNAGSVRVMVNNPPCFSVQTGLEAVPIPDGGISSLLQTADRFDVRYVLLDSNTPAGLYPLFTGEVEDPRLVKATEDVTIGNRKFAIYFIRPSNSDQDHP